MAYGVEDYTQTNASDADPAIVVNKYMDNVDFYVKANTSTSMMFHCDVSANQINLMSPVVYTGSGVMTEYAFIASGESIVLPASEATYVNFNYASTIKGITYDIANKALVVPKTGLYVVEQFFGFTHAICTTAAQYEGAVYTGATKILSTYRDTPAHTSTLLTSLQRVGYLSLTSGTLVKSRISNLTLATLTHSDSSHRCRLSLWRIG